MGLPVCLRRAAIAAVVLTLGLPASSSIGSIAPGTITYQSLWTTVATPRPGVVLQRKTILVAGYRGYRTVWRVSWALGNSHISLDADPLGWYRRSDSAFGGARIASLDGAGFVAGINGDTFAGGWFCGPCYLHGLLVHNRDVKNFGSGGPAVGFLAGGQMQMGQPAAVPVKLLLAGRGAGSSATVGAWNSLTDPSGRTIRADQVAVYTSGLARPVPSGYIAVTLQTPAFARMLTGVRSLRNSTGLGLTEPVQAFRFAEPAAPPVIATVPIVGTPAVYPDSFAVPAGSAVLVARLGRSTTNVPYAGTVLQTLATRVGEARSLRVTLDDQGWGAVDEVMDGKFQLVARGVAQTAYPGWSDSWPWTCMGSGHGCWRTALARSSTRGWLLIMGQIGSSYGLTTPDWARVLQRLGAVDAMGFDSNSAAELYRTGGARIANPDGGRVIPSATALLYH